MTARRLAVVLALALSLACASVCARPPALARAAVLDAALDPEHLGQSTTIELGFQIPVAGTRLPAPMTDIELKLPAGLIGGSVMLGLDICEPATLAERGPQGCPPDSLMGRGSAVVAVPFGPGALYETVALTIFMGQLTSGDTTLWLYADGGSPVIAQLIFRSLLVGDSAPFGARLQTAIPAIPGLPGAPAASLVSMRLSIGPKGLTYYKRVHGANVAYVPEGFSVPPRCPRGGFPFAARFGFADGSTQSAAAAVRCPPRRAPLKRRR